MPETKSPTAEELAQELIETKAKLADLQEAPAPKKKPYTKAEISSLEKDKHIIGAAHQKLSEGHSEDDLQKWNMWLCELELKDVGKLPETGEAWSVPSEITPLKIATGGKMGNDKSFQWENKSINFRERGANKQIFFNFPDGTVEAGKKYTCHYFVEVSGRGADQRKLIHLVVSNFPRATNAPTDKTLWGKG